jgi:hypothetical protein
MFWDLYYVCKQQDVTIKKVWDGNVLKLIFRRVFKQIMRRSNFSSTGWLAEWMYKPNTRIEILTNLCFYLYLRLRLDLELM